MIMRCTLVAEARSCIFRELRVFYAARPTSGSFFTESTHTRVVFSEFDLLAGQSATRLNYLTPARTCSKTRNLYSWSYHPQCCGTLFTLRLLQARRPTSRSLFAKSTRRRVTCPETRPASGSGNLSPTGPPPSIACRGRHPRTYSISSSPNSTSIRAPSPSTPGSGSTSCQSSRDSVAPISSLLGQHILE